MRISILSPLPLPENAEDLQKLQTEGKLRYTHCKDCGKAFSPALFRSPAGYRESQISGLCEICFDTLFND